MGERIEDDKDLGIMLMSELQSFDDFSISEIICTTAQSETMSGEIDSVSPVKNSDLQAF